MFGFGTARRGYPKQLCEEVCLQLELHGFCVREIRGYTIGAVVIQLFHFLFYPLSFWWVGLVQCPWQRFQWVGNENRSKHL